MVHCECSLIRHCRVVGSIHTAEIAVANTRDDRVWKIRMLLVMLIVIVVVVVVDVCLLFLVLVPRLVVGPVPVVFVMPPRYKLDVKICGVSSIAAKACENVLLLV